MSGRVSGNGEGDFSLSGLISPGPGRVGDVGDLTKPETSTFFHLVDVVDVLMGDGRGGRDLPDPPGRGV